MKCINIPSFYMKPVCFLIYRQINYVSIKYEMDSVVTRSLYENYLKVLNKVSSGKYAKLIKSPNGIRSFLTAVTIFKL